ncbi:MAG TPA: rRNA maturation RNase YbeY [Gemmatimonadaceae bacterium]|nr:rRNA maturation RNase YbeY [Gemmatimonadaceae bacterium]
MSHRVAVALEKVRIPVSRDRVAAVARAVLRSEKVRDAMLSITFVSARAIRTLNRRHLRRDRPTDVIAFGFRERGNAGAVVGDVYISPDAARESARANGVTVREEIVRLVVHGTLHVLGHDHPETDARVSSAMWRRQERLVRRLAR